MGKRSADWLHSRDPERNHRTWWEAMPPGWPPEAYESMDSRGIPSRHVGVAGLCVSASPTRPYLGVVAEVEIDGALLKQQGLGAIDEIAQCIGHPLSVRTKDGMDPYGEWAPYLACVETKGTSSELRFVRRGAMDLFEDNGIGKNGNKLINQLEKFPSGWPSFPKMRPSIGVSMREDFAVVGFMRGTVSFAEASPFIYMAKGPDSGFDLDSTDFRDLSHVTIVRNGVFDGLVHAVADLTWLADTRHRLELLYDDLRQLRRVMIRGRRIGQVGEELLRLGMQLSSLRMDLELMDRYPSTLEATDSMLYFRVKAPDSVTKELDGPPAFKHMKTRYNRELNGLVKRTNRMDEDIARATSYISTLVGTRTNRFLLVLTLVSVLLTVILVSLTVALLN